MESAIAKGRASRHVRVAAAVFSWAFVAGLAGCAGEADGPSRGVSSGQAVSDEAELASRAVCPSDVLDAVGKACTDDLVCTYRVSCEAVDQQTTCRCEDGVLTCEDALGVLASNQAPRCLRAADAVPAECPETLAEAAGLACDVAGSACFYAGKTCEERSAQHLDRCFCEAQEDGEFRFTCEVNECRPMSG